ncbi:hypothetical protein [Dysgonomonas sp.]
MKRKLNCKLPLRKRGKIGDSQIITISDSGTISGQGETKMRIGEMAGLFGIYYRAAKRHIRTLYFEKAGVVRGDDSIGCIVEEKNIYREYYGLDMVIALAFRIQSKKCRGLPQMVIQEGCKEKISEYE